MRELPLILALDVAGQPLRWVTYEDAAYYYAKDLVAWTPTEDDYTIYGGKRRIDGETSSLKMNTIIAIKGKISAKHQQRMVVPPLTNRALFRRDMNTCAYCGQSSFHSKSKNHLTRDHIHPRSRGGKDNWKNVVAACGSCNKRKDNRTPEEAGMELLYIPYVPTRNEWLILQNRNILADQMEFLMKGVPKHSRLHSN